jgi:hypothetical protein
MSPLAAARQAAALRETAHRPWPLPDDGWVLAQTLDDVLLAHWPVSERALRPLVPRALELERHGGSCWLSVVAFHVSALRLRGTLPLPLLSSFDEVNVRTYVRRRGRPGIWPFSLDTSSLAAAEAARRAFHLPFHRARIHLDRAGDWLSVSCARGEGEAFTARVVGRGRPFRARPGTLEHFLTERYCLYTARPGLHRAEIHHAPWELRRAEGKVVPATLTPESVRLAGEPILHVAARTDILLWPLEPVEGA